MPASMALPAGPSPAPQAVEIAWARHPRYDPGMVSRFRETPAAAQDGLRPPAMSLAGGATP